MTDNTARFTTAAAARAFMTAGRKVGSTVTMVSTKEGDLDAGTRFTYKIRANDDGDVFFVSVLRGADNTAPTTPMWTRPHRPAGALLGRSQDPQAGRHRPRRALLAGLRMGVEGHPARRRVGRPPGAGNLARRALWPLQPQADRPVLDRLGPRPRVRREGGLHRQLGGLLVLTPALTPKPPA